MFVVGCCFFKGAYRDIAYRRFKDIFGALTVDHSHSSFCHLSIDTTQSIL